THLSHRIARQDVDLSDDIAMRAETTPPAGIHPAAWFVPASAVGTGLGCIVFVDQCHRDPFGFGLVGDVLADAAVVPLRGLLIMLLAVSDAIGNRAHIAERDRSREPLSGHIHHRAAELVLHIAHDALVFGAHTTSGPLQAFVTATAFALAAECFAQ